MDNLKTELATLKKNLNILREREAKFGGNAPLELLNQIDDHLKAIELIQQVLDGQFTRSELEAELAPLNIAVHPSVRFELEQGWPFNTAPPLPDYFVERSVEFQQLIDHLLAETDAERTVALTISLQGGGGFGKTTLAQAICYHPEVQEKFKGGILWVELGPTPNLVGLLTDQINLLSQEKTSFTDINLAAARWRELLSDRCVLLVLDDLWDDVHARPFLPLAPQSISPEINSEEDARSAAHSTPASAVLITTRRQDMAIRLKAQAVLVNEMTLDEATSLLINWLDTTLADLSLLQELARYLGEWPLLLRLAGAYLREMVELDQQPLAEAIIGLRRRLERRGFTYLDRSAAGERDKAISISLDLSLERLGQWRERYLDLAVFPQNVAVPFATVERLWQQTAGLDELDTEDALRAMHRLSLFTRYDPAQQIIELHTIIWGYLIDQLGDRLTELHTQLLDAFRSTLVTAHINWALPPDEPYLWDHLAYHLIEATLGQELVRTVKDLLYLVLKSYLRGVLAVENDLEAAELHQSDDFELRLLRRSFVQSSHLLSKCHHPKDITTTLYSRLWHLETLAELTQPLADRLKQTVLLPRHRLPDLPHPALIRTLSSHTDVVTGCAISSDGQLIVSASEDRTLKIWDASSGSERHTLVGHSAWISDCDISADGTVIVSASADTTLKIWDADRGQARATLRGHRDRVNSCAISADGRMIVSASEDRTVKVWDARKESARLTLSGHTARVNSCAISADGRIIASASDDKTVKVWDVEDGTERLTLSGHSARVIGCAISADGRVIVSASEDHNLKVWDALGGSERLTLLGHSGWVNDCAISADGRLFVSASADKTLKVWDVEEGTERVQLSGHTGGVSGCATSKDGRLIVSASVDKTLKIWDADSGELKVSTFPVSTSMVSDCATRVDGRLVVLATGDGLNVWDVERGTERFNLTGHTDTVLACAVNTDGRIIVSASADKSLNLWDAGRGVTRHLAGHTGAVLGCAVSAEGGVAVSASTDHTLKVWDVENGTERLTLSGHSGPVWACAISEKGHIIVSASADHTLKVWSGNQGTERFTLSGHDAPVRDCAVIPDGQIVVSASEDHTLKVWDIETGIERLTLLGHSDSVRGCAISPDGQLIVSASEDQRLKVWDATTGDCLTTLAVDGILHACSCSVDCQLVVAVGSAGAYFFQFIR